MHLEKNGNYVIDDIKFQKNKIILILDGEKISISEATYSHFYLYKGRKISQEELTEISEYQNKTKLYDYSFKLVSNGNYFEKQIRDKLKKKKASNEQINEIIVYLSQKGYIDDKKTLLEAFEIYERKNYGKNKIIDHLLKDGVSKMMIESLPFDNEIKKAEAISDKYILMHKDYNFVQMKRGLYNHLLANGFNYDDIERVINNKMKNFDVDEDELLLKAAKKYVLLHHLILNDEVHREKVVSYLLRKGYRYEDIKEVIRRLENEIY